MKKIFTLAALVCMTVGCAAQPRKTDTFATASGKTVTFTCIKHASIQMEYDGCFFYFDPVTGLKPETNYTAFPKANYIIITHEHPDHFDRMALNQLATPSTVAYANQSVGEMYRKAVQMHNGDSVSITSRISLKAVPAYNTTAGREQFHPKGRDNGYVLTVEDLRIYVAGDTEDIPEMEQLGPIDIAFLPCNQPYTMTPAQLAKAAKTIRPKVLFPYHYSDTPIRQLTLLLSGSGIDVRIRDYQ